MKAILLAAGLGSRLGPLTESVPKPMVKIDGKPILEHNLERLKQAGILDVIINVHYLPEAITGYFGDGQKFGLNIKYFTESELSGSAGMLKKAKNFFSEEFLLVYADSLYLTDFSKIISAKMAEQSVALIALFDKKKNAYSGTAGGLVELAENGNISGFWEGANRPELSLVNAGIYKLSPEIFQHIPEGRFYDFGKHLFPDLLAKRVALEALVLNPSDAVLGIDTPEYLEKTLKYLYSIKGKIS